VKTEAKMLLSASAFSSSVDRRLWSLHPWRCPKHPWTWSFRFGSGNHLDISIWMLQEALLGTVVNKYMMTFFYTIKIFRCEGGQSQTTIFNGLSPYRPLPLL